MTEADNTINPNRAVYTINNPESVIEVFLDTQKKTVREFKSLNHNRYKEYYYSVKEYLSRYSHHPAGQAVSNALSSQA